MVLDYYNLREEPFGVTPDPRFLYMSAGHREALASLEYGIRSRRGFMSLIAPPGMGKTTILFRLLSQLEGMARTVFLFQTLCSPLDLLRALLRDLGAMVPDNAEIGCMQQQLNSLLVAEARQGRRVVVIIDEAQNLDDSALELVRMLSNFETASYKLMQIILSGQPQLRQKLASPHLLQLRQRMSICARVHPFTLEETNLYVRHRLQVAGYHSKTPLFTAQAAALIAKYSEGIPRNINNICFNALSLGCVLKQKSIHADAVSEALADLDIEVDSTDPSEKEAERPQFVPLGASKPPARAPFAWRRRIAACTLLILQVLWSGSGWRGEESQRLSAKIMTSPPVSVQVVAAMPVTDSGSADSAAKRGPKPGVEGRHESRAMKPPMSRSRPL